MKKITLLLLFMAFLTLNGQLKAQETMRISEFDPYVSAYMEPFAKAMAVSMSAGWTHTAEVHSTLGFDITLNATLVNIPTTDYSFNPQELDMPLYTWNKNSTPTISDNSEMSAAQLSRQFNDPNIPDLSVAMFEGMKLNKGGMAGIQAGIGLPKGFELIVRYVPNVSKPVNNILSDVGDITLSKTGMWGFGIKHDIKQWIPVVKKVPFLQMSVLGAYTKMYTGFSGPDMTIDPDRLGASSTLPTSTWEGQSFDMEISSFTGSFLVGASLPVFQPFIGLGFNSGKFDGGFKGNYPVITVDPNDGTDYYKVLTSEKDPLTIEAKNTNFNFQAGARIKLGFFVLHYQYTIQQYSMHNAGIAFTFR